MALTQASKTTLTAASNTITFTTQMPDTSYALTYRCYDADGVTIACDISGIATTGFTAAPMEWPSYLEWIVVAYGDGSLICPSQHLSRDYTVSRLWAEAVRDIAEPAEVGRLDFEQFRLINRAVNAVAEAFYPLIVDNYITDPQTVVPSSDKISLLGARVHMGVVQNKMSIESTVATYVNFVSQEAYDTFRSSSIHNSKRIVFTLKGDYIYLARGSSLASYGTLTITYPRVPVEVTATTDHIDLPDGAMMEMAILKLRKLVADRLGQKYDPTNEMLVIAKQIYEGLGVQVNVDKIRTEVERII